MPFKSCRFYRKTNFLSSSSVKLWFQTWVWLHVQKGNIVFLEPQKWFPAQKPTIWAPVGEARPLCLTWVQTERLGPDFEGRGGGKKKVVFWCLQGFTRTHRRGTLLALLARGVCKSSKGGVSVWFTSLWACVCVCQRYIWAGVDRGGWEGPVGGGGWGCI